MTPEQLAIADLLKWIGNLKAVLRGAGIEPPTMPWRAGELEAAEANAHSLLAAR